jgi:hypothetical protein
MTNSLPVTGEKGMSAVLTMGANKITGVTDPTNPQDAATKNYVDTKVGRLIAIQLLTVTGTYTRTAGATTGDVFLIGGPGGGGGAAATGAAQFSVGSGGGSGALTVALNVALPATASITIGAKGSVNVGASGGAGGTTSFTGGALTLTAPGGGAGIALGPSGPAGTPFGVPPGAGAAAGTFTGGSFASGGQEGAYGIGALAAGTQALRGSGGMSTLWGFGWGGYGNALGPSSAAVAGFQGSAAAIIVVERT